MRWMYAYQQTSICIKSDIRKRKSKKVYKRENGSNNNKKKVHQSHQQNANLNTYTHTYQKHMHLHGEQIMMRILNTVSVCHFAELAYPVRFNYLPYTFRAFTHNTVTNSKDPFLLSKMNVKKGEKERERERWYKHPTHTYKKRAPNKCDIIFCAFIRVDCNIYAMHISVYEVTFAHFVCGH